MTEGQAFSHAQERETGLGLRNPDPGGIDQRPTWSPKEIPFDDDRTLVLEHPLRHPDAP